MENEGEEEVKTASNRDFTLLMKPRDLSLVDTEFEEEEEEKGSDVGVSLFE